MKDEEKLINIMRLWQYYKGLHFELRIGFGEKVKGFFFPFSP